MHSRFMAFRKISSDTQILWELKKGTQCGVSKRVTQYALAHSFVVL